MSGLDLALLGGVEARDGLGGPLAVPTRKAQALLAYLALTPGQTHPRDKPAALLWPDAPPGLARAALRQTLFVVRKALQPAGGAALVMTGDAIALPPEAGQTDVAAFEDFSSTCPPGTLAAGGAGGQPSMGHREVRRGAVARSPHGRRLRRRRGALQTRMFRSQGLTPEDPRWSSATVS
jgi:hypothetical protein